MKPTPPSLRERCDIALACLPQAEYRERLAALFDDLLAPKAVMLTADDLQAKVLNKMSPMSSGEFIGMTHVQMTWDRLTQYSQEIQRAFAAKNGIELKEPK